MQPSVLGASGLRLDQPGPADVDLIAAYCRDPVFERFMTTPWPYERSHAESFVGEFVPRGWAEDRECTWAIRASAGDELLGVIGLRHHRRGEHGDLGFWLGAPHRGQGIMPRAVSLVVDWAFDRLALTTVFWECVPGNLASATVAAKSGFTFIGEAPGTVPARDGSPVTAWRARRDAGAAADAASWSPLAPALTIAPPC